MAVWNVPLTPDKSGAIGTDCVTGTVNGVDVALCTFAKPEDAAAAKDKAYAWIGNNVPTGSASSIVLVTRNTDQSSSTRSFCRARSSSNTRRSEWGTKPSNSTATFASGQARSRYRTRPPTRRG